MTGAASSRAWISVALGAAVLLFVPLSLTAISRPSHYDERLELLRSTATRVLASDAMPAQPSAVLCRGDIAKAKVAVTSAVSTIAQASQVRVGAAEFADLEAPQPGVQGAKVHLALDGDDRALALTFAALAEQRLPVFIDSAELTSAPSGAVRALIDGRVLCERGAR